MLKNSKGQKVATPHLFALFAFAGLPALLLRRGNKLGKIFPLSAARVVLGQSHALFWNLGEQLVRKISERSELLTCI